MKSEIITTADFIADKQELFNTINNRKDNPLKDDYTIVCNALSEINDFLLSESSHLTITSEQLRVIEKLSLNLTRLYVDITPKKEICPFCNFDDGVEMLYEWNTSDGEMIDAACIVKPTPISIRKNPKRPAKILVSNDIEIPIAYCPICGRKL